MKILTLALATTLLAPAACRRTDDNPRRTELPRPIEPASPPAATPPSAETPEPVAKPPDTPVPAPEPAPPADPEFVEVRTTYADRARERLDRIEIRLGELADRTDAESRAAAVRLRAERDAIGRKLDRIGEQVKTNWKQFESDMGNAFDRLERELDAATR